MYIKVRAFPSAPKESVDKMSDDTFTISVKEPAEDNRANRRIIELVAKQFGISTSSVRIISGHHSPGKILSVSVD